MFGKRIRKVITIFGNVQGVGFRYAARSAAVSLRVNGIASNLPDGTVRIEAEGSRKAVEAFVDWCREGPSYATVNRIEAEELPPAGYKTFEVAP
jgi:acylphosphatase